MHAKNRLSALKLFLRSIFGERPEDWLVRMGVLAALLAFLWAGAIENKASTNPLIKYPWTLFLFFSFILIMLELDILRDPKLPKQWAPTQRMVNSLLAVTGVSVLIFGVGRLWGQNLLKWAEQHLPNVGAIVNELTGQKAALFFWLNLVLIIIFWAGILFFSRAGRATSEDSPESQLPGQHAAGNFVAAIISSLLLGVVFNPLALNLLAGLLSNHAVSTAGSTAASQPITACDLNYFIPQPPNPASCTVGVLAPWSVPFLDLICLPLLYFICAYAILSGPATALAIREGRAVEIPYTLRETFVELWHREMQLPTLILPLRAVWPVLIFGAVFSAGVAADNTANAIQYVSTHAIVTDQHKHIQWQSIWFWFSRYGNNLWENLGYRFGAVLAVGVAVLLTVVAVTVIIVPDQRSSSGISALRRQIIFSWHHLQLMVGVLIFSYGLGSLAFSAVDALILVGVNSYELNSHINALAWHWVPFVQPDPVAIPCLLLLLFYMIRGRPARPRKTIKRATPD